MTKKQKYKHMGLLCWDCGSKIAKNKDYCSKCNVQL